MTIKEIEARSAIPRATIRYYEQEGLLSPRREPNGYRDYSEGDLTALKRILLLRELSLSLEEIRALQRGERALSDALSARLLALEAESDRTERASAVCQSILAEGVRYADLNADRYLAAIYAPVSPGAAIQADRAAPSPPHPWRRFFARQLDLILYGLLWHLLLCALLGVDLLTLPVPLLWLSELVPLVMMLLVEPLLLRLFGTTPGKWLFGLSLEAENGGRPPYLDGLSRTLRVLWRGLAWQLPVLSLVFLIRSFRRCARGAALPWETEDREPPVCRIRDLRVWRCLVCAAALCLLLFLNLLTIRSGTRPPNRGALTVAEFAENYNAAQRKYHLAEGWKLDEGGHFVRAGNSDVFYLDFGEKPEDPRFVLDDSGHIRSIDFSLEVEAGSGETLQAPDRLRLAAMAFLPAQPAAGLFYDPAPLAARLGPTGSWEALEAGVTLRYSHTADGPGSVISLSMALPAENPQ